MKKYFSLLVVLLPIFSFCQSVTLDKLISYSKFQNLKIIANDLDQKGFITKIDDAQLGAVKTEDSKTASEVVQCIIVREHNNFSVVYQSPIYFSKIKKIAITPKFSSSFKPKESKYSLITSSARSL